MSQLSYNENHDVAFAGMRANAQFDYIESFQSEGVIQFGYGVVEGTDKAKQVQAPSADTETLVGIAIQMHKEPESDGDVQYNDKDTVGVLRKGSIWSPYVDAISPAVGETAYVNVAVASEEGKITNVSTGNIALGGLIREVDTTNKLVRVDINLP